MATLLKIGDTWRAQIRRKGHKSISETFLTTAQAATWTRKTEAEMDAKRFNDTRELAHITLNALIEWYEAEVGAAIPFDKNKASVLRLWQRDHATSYWPTLLPISSPCSCVTAARPALQG